MTRTVIYMAVQVVRRHADKTLLEWYDGELRSSYREAKDDLDQLAGQHPGTPYQVVERTIKEIGPERCGVVRVGNTRRTLEVQS